MTREGKTAVLPTVGNTNLAAAREPAPDAVSIEVLDGPMDGLQVVSSAPRIRMGRNEDNDLPIAEDLLVSGSHAELRRTTDPEIYELEDLGSSNKTWVDGEALVTTHRIRIGTYFVLGGQTVIGLGRAEGEESSPILNGRELMNARAELLGRLAANINSALGAASMLACQEQRSFINDRHLFLGLAMTEADQPLFERGRGPVDESLLYQLLWRESYWDEAPWIDERITRVQVAKFFAYQRIWTPRLVRLLTAAEEASRQRGRARIDAVDLLRALVGSRYGRVRRWLGKNGRNIDELLRVLDSTPATSLAPQSTAERTMASAEHLKRATRLNIGKPEAGGSITSSPSGGTDSLYVSRAFTSGDPGLDNRAQEAGRQLYGFAALYQLAETDDRRQGMRRLLEEHMAEVPDEKRRRWLEQLRRLFPLDGGSTDASGEIERLHQWVAELKNQVGELEKQLSGRGGSLPWHLVLGTPSTTDLDALNPAERPRVEVLREVFQFGLHLEKLITGMVHDFTAGIATESAALQLPGHRTSLRNQVMDIKAGRQVSLGDLRRYLADLESWLIAGLIAFNAAPEEWFKEFWQQYSPRAIEAQAESGFARFGPNLWNRYKEAARRISPDIAAQHVRRKAQEIAKNQHRKMAEGRISSG